MSQQEFFINHWKEENVYLSSVRGKLTLYYKYMAVLAG